MVPKIGTPEYREWYDSYTSECPTCAHGPKWHGAFGCEKVTDGWCKCERQFPCMPEGGDDSGLTEDQRSLVEGIVSGLVSGLEPITVRLRLLGMLYKSGADAGPAKAAADYGLSLYEKKWEAKRS